MKKAVISEAFFGGPGQYPHTLNGGGPGDCMTTDAVARHFILPNASGTVWAHYLKQESGDYQFQGFVENLSDLDNA